MQIRVGLIGLGIMGKPMAKNLLKAGFPLIVHNRSQAAVEELVKQGATAAHSPREVFGTKAGVDPRKMVRALAGGLAGSKCLDQKSEKILTGDFTPGFKVDLHFKDLNLIHEAARSIGAPIPTAAFIEQLFAALRTRGRGGLDHSGVITLLEDLAGIEVRKLP